MLCQIFKKNSGLKGEPAGIYVHIPFCRRKCSYCDFYSVTDFSFLDAFVQALECEMILHRGLPLVYDSVYIGGGTPSALHHTLIGRIINSALQTFTILSDAEITIEVNPGTVTKHSISSYRYHGINRLSIGIQSFQDNYLKFLGRIHSAKDGIRTIEHAQKAGVKNIGLDLIYGLPGQSLQTWVSDLQMALKFKPDHLSCYMLTYERGTPLFKDRRKGIFQPLRDESIRKLFYTTVDVLEAHGYEQYEVSNFAKSKSKRSRHNQKYWSTVAYIGLGPSAHSYLNPVRFWKISNTEKYISVLQKHRIPLDGLEVLSNEQALIETLFLELRQRRGIDISVFNQRFSVDFLYLFGDILSFLAENGMIHLNQNCCTVTRKGLIFIDSITSMLASIDFREKGGQKQTCKKKVKDLKDVFTQT
jgi:oxygen-independent coproporphyrinogen-3 oxidase